MPHAGSVRASTVFGVALCAAVASVEVFARDSIRHGSTLVGTIDPADTVEEQLAKAEIVIREHTRATNTEACANVCPILDDAGQQRFATQVVTTGASAWCVARRCPEGDAVAAIHSHAYETFTAKWIDALHDPRINPGKRISPGRTFSELDRRHPDLYLVLEDRLLRWYEGMTHEVR